MLKPMIGSVQDNEYLLCFLFKKNVFQNNYNREEDQIIASKELTVFQEIKAVFI